MDETTITLDQAIRDLIFNTYGVCYTGRLRVKHLLTGGYELIMYFDVEEKPIRIYADLPWDKFLEFIKQELRNRHWHSTKYYTGYKIDFPYDKGRINRRN